MRPQPAADQPRGTRPCAVKPERLDRGLCHEGLRRQSQIIVAANRNQLTTVNGGLHVLWRLQKPPAAQQSL